MSGTVFGVPAAAAMAIFQLLAASTAFAVEMDRVCWKSFVPNPKTALSDDVCEILGVERGKVTYVEPGNRRLVLGKYVGAAQRFVPRTEAPIRDLQSPRGWHIIVSSVLQKEDLPRLRVRFFGIDGDLRATEEVRMALEEIEIGRLFGGSDDILAIQSNEEHSYNSMTSVWLLPERGGPKELIEDQATLGRFSRGGNNARPGVLINRQTYDGVNSATKGWATEFWAWDPAKKSLTPEKK
jgi:hypothetical protein